MIKKYKEFKDADGNIVKVGDMVEIIVKSYTFPALRNLKSKVYDIEFIFSNHGGSVDDRGETWTTGCMYFKLRRPDEKSKLGYMEFNEPTCECRKISSQCKNIVNNQ